MNFWFDPFNSDENFYFFQLGLGYSDQFAIIETIEVPTIPTKTTGQIYPRVLRSL